LSLTGSTPQLSQHANLRVLLKGNRSQFDGVQRAVMFALVAGGITCGTAAADPVPICSPTPDGFFAVDSRSMPAVHLLPAKPGLALRFWLHPSRRHDVTVRLIMVYSITDE
jgi:hypothetical protein